MTFQELKTEIKERLHYVSAEADARVGRLINKVYRELTSSIGLATSREVSVIQGVSPGEREVVFAGVEKLLTVWYEGAGGKPVVLEQVLPAELATDPVPTSTIPRRFAVRRMGANTVTIWLDILPASAFDLRADGMTEVADLSGSQEPAFPESFHDIIIEGVLKDEYQKLEKVQLARLAEERYHRRLSDLRMFIAKTNFLDVYQNKRRTAPRGAVGGGGGTPGAGLNHLDLTITGHWTFDRDPAAPFSVTAGSALVVNLDADLLDGLHASDIVANAVSSIATELQAGNLPHGSTHSPAGADPLHVAASDRLLGRDAAGAGDVELIAVTGGLEFTGSGGIQRSALTGDVTASAGSSSTTIAPNAVTTSKIADDQVTYAKMQNVTAASRLLGRGSAGGAGDPEELTASGGVEISGTTVQRSALTGDVTASAGSSTTTIANNAVTYAKMQDVSAASRLLGRGSSAGAGDPEEITLGSGLSMSGTTLSATGGGGGGINFQLFPLGAELPSSNFPQHDVRNNHPVLAFDDTADEACFWGVRLRGYTGGTLNVHIFWTGATATSGNVVWGAAWEDWTVSGQDLDSDGFATEKTVASSTPGTSGVLQRADMTFSSSEIDGLTANAAGRLRIRRIGSHASDTQSGDAHLLMVAVYES